MNMKIFAKLSTVLCFLLALIIGCTEKETQVEVSSVSLNTATIEMVEGETFSLMATVLPKDAEYDGVTWASSNASVASVNSGTVTALKKVRPQSQPALARNPPLAASRFRQGL